MRDWPELPLGEIYHFGSGLSKPADQFGFGYPFLTFREVFNNYFVPKELTSLVNATEKERRSCSIKRGDAFLTRTSETDDDLGMSCVALKDYPDATFNGFTKRLRPNGRVEIHPEFAGYFFRTKRFQAEIAGMSSVTTRASLNNDMLSQLRMLVPPIDEQRAIAEILSSLDDKIDLLHRQSKTLERLAETLFRRWFIEEAKPDWPTKRIRDLAEINTLSVDRNFEHDEIKYLDTGSITESVVAGYELLSLSEAPSRARRLVKQNSIIYSLVRPIQRHFGILKNPKPNTVVSTGFAVIDATKIDPHFLYLFLTQDEMTEYLDSVAEGSTS
ncbi:MAG: restriction endonuclease subunit S, partial [Acidobacteria bacterium]|nr:restriction endonuclease subunit S [Acidobacteriota bacterium]